MCVCERECVPTIQHGQVHGIVGPLGDTEHHFESILDLTFTLLTARQQLLEQHRGKHTCVKTEWWWLSASLCVSVSLSYLEQELVFSDSLDRLDQVGGDGVCQTMSLLDFLQTREGDMDTSYSCLYYCLQKYPISQCWVHLHQSRVQHVPGWAAWSQACSYSNSHTSGTCQPDKEQQQKHCTHNPFRVLEV